MNLYNSYIVLYKHLTFSRADPSTVPKSDINVLVDFDEVEAVSV